MNSLIYETCNLQWKNVKKVVITLSVIRACHQLEQLFLPPASFSRNRSSVEWTLQRILMMIEMRYMYPVFTSYHGLIGYEELEKPATQPSSLIVKMLHCLLSVDNFNTLERLAELGSTS